MSPLPDHAPAAADLGLLSPVSAGTRVEALTGDQAVVAAMIHMEAGLLRALAETGLAPRDLRETADVVAAVEPDVRALALGAVEGGNPVIPLVRQLRAAVADNHASWVHFGATSQDTLDTALALVAAEAARHVEADLVALAGTLATLADRHRHLPVVARTLGQQALPTTLGLRVATWLAGVHDAIRLVRGCTSMPVSLGGPVGTAAAYGDRGPLVTDAVATELGMSAPVAPWHTRRTPVLNLGHAFTTAGGSCAKIAADVLIASQQEVAELRERSGGPSSAMQHKANPTQSVLVASAGRQLPALASVLLGSAAAEQERPAGAWHAEWQPLRALLRVAGGAVERTCALTATLVLDPEAMHANLERLRMAVAGGDSWVAEHTRHADVWIDRVLAQHDQICG